ncbi:MAG: AAA domain-containing protein [Chlorobiaceae bacterium]
MSEKKKRIRALYQFLREANQLRFRPVRRVEDQPRYVSINTFPEHPDVQLYRPVMNEGGSDVPDTLISVRRPVLTKCPAPPAILAEWLISGWDNPSINESFVEGINRTDEEGETFTEAFTDEPERVNASFEWRIQRKAWAVPEKAALRAMSVFETFYEIYSAIEKDAEQLELIVADGHLAWETVSERDSQVVINHPILLKRVELRFDPNKPEFTVHETDREPELYGGLFIDLTAVSPSAIKNRQDELSLSGYHPLGWADTNAFLKAFIQTVSPLKGEYREEPSSPSQVPQLWRAPVLILRKRVFGIANAIDTIIDDIDKQEVFPPALGQITGTGEEGTWKSEGLGGNTSEAYESSFDTECNDILLAKPSNKEQTQIIKRLQRSGSVLVQGPPGTGKTHTIGNIIGHLLSQGKSVLVTSHTTKALRVLRDKVPEILQPLCVSVLGSDGDARTQLESSIGAITERLTRGSCTELLAQAQQMSAERLKLLTKIRENSHKLRQALENEYRELVVNGKEYSPSEAARHVASNKILHGWIPAPVKLGSSFNMATEELTRLYALGGMFSVEEEQDACLPLPELTKLPSDREFEVMVNEFTNLTTSDISFGQEKWDEVTGCSSASITELAYKLSMEFSDDLRSQQWRPHAIVVGIHGGTAREVWEQVISKIEEACEASAQHSLVLHHKPKLSGAFSVIRQKQLATEICIHLEGGGKLGMLQLVTKSEWRKFIGTSSVSAGNPAHRDHFDALHKLAHLESLRSELEALWNVLVGQITGETFRTRGMTPELACRPLIPEMKRCLAWHSKSWLPLVEQFKNEGLKLDNIIASIPCEASPIAEYTLIEKLAVNVLPPLLESETARRRLKECEKGFKALEELSSKMDAESSNRGCVGRIVTAVRSCNKSGYAAALNYAQRLHSVKPLVDERNQLIAKLRLVAPTWAEQIVMRIPPHNGTTIIGDVIPAWVWRQLHDELAERDKLDAQALQQEIDKSKSLLQKITVSLIEALAWEKQIERLQCDKSVNQALESFLETKRRLTSIKQVTKKQMFETEARKLMKQCAKAVPVWVMPISILAESFDLRTTKFDVVIIDEASQADLNALIPLYMAKQVIIVGDHEQVTPLGVGKDQVSLENLRCSILQDVPHSHLYDNLSSIYDIARLSFGDTIRLTEHFRCVPEIIAFSNQLSYQGSIRPLRETNSSNLKPACIPYRVHGIRESDVNNTEAETIVSLIEAMIKHPAYESKTIGVISMVGKSQAMLIEAMLHKRIDSVELQKRRIQAGISAQFQGDERDVIFLSFIDSQGDEGYIRAMGEGAFEQTKKRFNVATSRARDQLWAVHSFDPDRHLKANDIRLKLLQHMKDPWSLVNAYNSEVAKTDSDFERQVLKRLTNAGYRVKSQWQVGYYRIDLVVEGGGKRLAIECDGDRYHPIEKISDDMERQAILERVGKWQFIRIRGSAFYRSPDEAMKHVFDRLEALDIPPIGQIDEQRVEDWSLIHELQELIAKASEDKGNENSDKEKEKRLEN